MTQTKSNAHLAWLLGILGLLSAFAGWQWWTTEPTPSRRQEEPIDPTPALVSNADLSGSFMMLRSIQEGQAKLARKKMLEANFSRDDLEEGSRAYAEMKNAVDASIEDLNRALDQGPTEEARRSLEKALTESAAKAEKFRAWILLKKIPTYFDGDPLRDIQKSVPLWLASVANASNVEKRRIRSTLESAKLPSWDSLKD